VFALAFQFVCIFLIILVFGYILPAGQLYVRYHVLRKPENEERRIQERRPTRAQTWREIRFSLLSIAIFAVMGTGLFHLWRAGWTAIYTNIREYPLWYLPVSFLLSLFVFDTYFYWLHRFMHWRPVFPYAHREHHRSVSPTPWAIYSFQPLEAILQFLGIMLLVVFLPMHPLILLAFLSVDTFVNAAGHTGYELVPDSLSKLPLLRTFNTVTHHDAHHTNTRVNFGAFFNLWDRWMGTFSEGATKRASQGASSGEGRLAGSLGPGSPR
jgi:sterol desaturase/sphingolipid hydroxylase (fatty acid hydroxylase superfamily)